AQPNRTVQKIEGVCLLRAEINVKGSIDARSRRKIIGGIQVTLRISPNLTAQFPREPPTRLTPGSLREKMLERQSETMERQRLLVSNIVYTLAFANSVGNLNAPFGLDPNQSVGGIVTRTTPYSKLIDSNPQGELHWFD
ncbi:MAG: hypothetical protein NWE76_04810, partial [Candidatus Bathyarchaeota archaeon]|nr:hypothetical protein [Candidatus Bathyarchaeota archaeon]